MSYVYVTTFAANLVTFSAGTVITWSSPELNKLMNASDTPFDTPISQEDGSWISSLFPLGAVFGLLYGYLADTIGRKYTLIACGVPLIFSYLLMAFGKSLALFFVARFISGVALGGLFMMMPMYVSEITDSHNRGALSSMMTVFLSAGMLFSFVLGPYVSVLSFNLILAVPPAIFVVVFFLIAPESPYYYASKQMEAEAKTAMQKLRGPTVNVEDELMVIHQKIKEAGKGEIMDIFRTKSLRKAFFITTGLLVFQQFTGINAVLFYSQTIFQQAGVSLSPAVCSIVVGIVQFAASFLAPLLVDRLGRKFLLMASALGMVLSEVPLGLYSYLKDNDHDVSSISFLPIACLVGYIFTYSFGFGPLPWTVLGEMFPSNIKSTASSIASTICWIFGFLIAKYFQSISDAIGMGLSFWIFAACCAMAVPFIMFVMIETKGKSLHEIQETLR